MDYSGDAFGRAMALHNIAAVHLALGEHDKVEVFLRESLKLSRHYRMRYLSNKNYLLSGRLRRRRNQLGKAEADLFRALGVFAKQAVAPGSPGYRRYGHSCRG